MDVYYSDVENVYKICKSLLPKYTIVKNYKLDNEIFDVYIPKIKTMILVNKITYSQKKICKKYNFEIINNNITYDYLKIKFRKLNNYKISVIERFFLYILKFFNITS